MFNYHTSINASNNSNNIDVFNLTVYITQHFGAYGNMGIKAFVYKK